MPMKFQILLFLSIMLVACGRRHHLIPKNIRAVRPVFRDSTFRHYSGYQVGTDQVGYDGMNRQVTEFLKSKASHRDQYAREPASNRIYGMIAGKKSAKMVPLAIKSVPLSEFGYLELADDQVVFYAIMGSDGFIDLTHQRGYSNSIKK